MEPAAIAVMLTVVFGIFAVLCAIVGIVLWCIERTRVLAPFVTFIPTLAMLGAAGASWSLGFLVAMIGPEFYGHAWWAWSIGLPIGGFLGGLFGLWLARFFHKKDEAA